MANRSVNKVILIGHLGRDAETRYTPAGVPVTRFTLATNRRVKDPATGEWKDETDWHNITVWRQENPRPVPDQRQAGLTQRGGSRHAPTKTATARSATSRRSLLTRFSCSVPAARARQRLTSPMRPSAAPRLRKRAWSLRAKNLICPVPSPTTTCLSDFGPASLSRRRSFSRGAGRCPSLAQGSLLRRLPPEFCSAAGDAPVSGSGPVWLA